MLTTYQISQLLEGELCGDPDIVITGPSKIEEGVEGTITFLANPKYESLIYETKASAILVSNDFVPQSEIKAALIKVADVYGSLGKLLDLNSSLVEQPKGISNQSFISSDAKIGANVAVSHFTVIESEASIGDNTILHSNVFIGKNVNIGKNCIFFAGVKIYHGCRIGDNCVIHSNAVIGSDGFGYSHDKDNGYKKIPQIGNVIIEDNVEIGANTVIDRASMGSTIIKKGVKLDNLIQIAHNVVIGENTAIAAQTGIAGSTKVGNNCIIGGQVGLAGHITIADGTMIQAKSGISANITEPNSKLYGYPALEYNQYLKSYVYFKKLPDLAEKLRILEKEIQKLKQQ
jgi:UDP-3-O-[3-hydroxymyristoyl] glucosamine N-acyltransferase